MLPARVVHSQGNWEGSKAGEAGGGVCVFVCNVPGLYRGWVVIGFLCYGKGRSAEGAGEDRGDA